MNFLRVQITEFGSQNSELWRHHRRYYASARTSVRTGSIPNYDSPHNRDASVMRDLCAIQELSLLFILFTAIRVTSDSIRCYHKRNLIVICTHKVVSEQTLEKHRRDKRIMRPMSAIQKMLWTISDIKRPVISRCTCMCVLLRIRLFNRSLLC